MHLRWTVLFATHACFAPGTSRPGDTEWFGGGRILAAYEVGVNYNFIHANAPPGQCGCFSMNGGSGTFVYQPDAQMGRGGRYHACSCGNVNQTGQNITIFNYLFGPRYSIRTSSRFVPYAEAMLGGAKENVNVQFDINRNAFGFRGGGGVSTTSEAESRLHHHRGGLDLYPHTERGEQSPE